MVIIGGKPAGGREGGSRPGRGCEGRGKPDSTQSGRICSKSYRAYRAKKQDAGGSRPDIRTGPAGKDLRSAPNPSPATRPGRF